MLWCTFYWYWHTYRYWHIYRFVTLTSRRVWLARQRVFTLSGTPNSTFFTEGGLRCRQCQLYAKLFSTCVVLDTTVVVWHGLSVVYVKFSQFCLWICAFVEDQWIPVLTIFSYILDMCSSLEHNGSWDGLGWWNPSSNHKMQCNALDHRSQNTQYCKS